jgi:dihydroorotate dehydrogenase electron transfer subunit
MGVCAYDNKSFTFIYKTVGNGTRKLVAYKSGEFLNVLIDLGNSYVYDKSYGKPLLVSGGSGLGPIFCLAKYLKSKHIPFECVIGFANKKTAGYVNEFKKLNPHTRVCTDDGSLGEKGNVVDVINKHKLNNLYYFTCGANAMMSGIYKACKHGQLSLDARMGCGFGACMGCAIETKNGSQRICKDGPIFRSEDLQ